MSITDVIRVERQYRDAWGRMRNSPEDTVASLEEALRRSRTDHRPFRCFEPEGMARGERLWGVSVQLYGVRSARNWGMGDFTDLTKLIWRSAREGADFIGLNPLHALYAAEPARFSPYSPSSREFLNVLYIDPREMLSFDFAPEAGSAIADPLFQQRLAALRDAELVDYPGIWAAKEEIFRLVFDAFEGLCADEPDSPLAVGFAYFIKERGETLRRFAVYQALSSTPGFGVNWRAWPEEYRDPDGAAIRQFMEANVRQIRYHAFLQWEADTQLAACAAAAAEAGMRIGLYLDVAVGAAPESAESWTEQGNLIPGFHIGAPPDAWNEAGQDWGLAVYDPYAMAHSCYDFFRRILGAVMRHARAIRIDHILGFYRLYLVPEGRKPTDGAYLHLPAVQLCDALARESRARKSLVIGEDLGTVPEGFPSLLADHNILSYRLLIFAKEGDRYLMPEEYPAGALIAVSTHDLPPLLGFWDGTDIRLRTESGLYPADGMRERALDERQRDRAAMSAVLSAAGFQFQEEDAASLAVAAYGFLARTPARLLLIQMEDLAMLREQPNIPGSVDLYPNWRRKLDAEIDPLFDDPRAAAVIAAIRRERPGNGGS